MGKEICVKAGKTAGGVVRYVVDTIKKTGKIGNSIGETISTGAKAVAEGWQSCCTGFDNFCKRIRYGSKTAAFESKQKDVFTRIGEKVFVEKELKKEEDSNILEDIEMKEFLEKASSHEKEIQKIKDELAIQKQKMDTIAVIKRAKEDLENKDARIRRVAIRVLERVGTKEVIPYLSNVLNDPDSEVRERASDVMHKLVEKFKEVQKSSATTLDKENEEHKKTHNGKTHKKKEISEEKNIKQKGTKIEENLTS